MNTKVCKFGVLSLFPLREKETAMTEKLPICYTLAIIK